MLVVYATVLGSFVATGTVCGQDTTGTGALSGVIRDTANAPSAFATVCLSGTTTCGVADDRGVFQIPNIRAGTYALEASAPGATALPLGRVEVRAGVDQRLDITLPSREGLATTVTVSASATAMPAEVKTSGYLITSREIAKDAGALQDVSRYIQSLPGVVIPPGSADFRNDIIVRGGSPLENLFVVDNVDVPNINTFANFASAGGTVSILDPAMIRDVTFLTGGFPASYSNRTSSVLQIAQREGDRERMRGTVTFNSFTGAGATLEGPIDGGKGSYVVSARRSIVDVFTKDVGVGGVPVLYALNAKAVYDLNARDRVWAVNVTGIDQIRLGPTDTTPNDQEVFNVDIRYHGWRSATGVNWQHLFGTRGVGLLGVTNATASVGQTVKDLVRSGVPPAALSADQLIAASPVVYHDESRESETTVKYDVTWTVGASAKVQAGGSLKQFRVNLASDAPLGYDNPYSPTPGADAFSLSKTFTAWQPGAYVQVTGDVAPRLNVTAGLRVDDYQYIAATRVSPRVGATFDLTTRLRAKASAGMYYQQPAFLFLAVFPKNRSLAAFRADHYVGGVTYTMSDRLTLSVEGYRKHYCDYPVATEYPTLSLANLGDTFNVLEVLFPLTSAGVGTAQGLELSAVRRDDGRWYGQTNLSWSRARYAALDGVLRPGGFDYPVVFNLTGGRRLTSKWEAWLRVAYLSGRPYTPFDLVESAQQRRGMYDLSQVNGVRAPAYFRADARIDWNTTLAGKPAIVFVGLQNVTGRRNFAGYSWNRRSNTIEANEQLGVFPLIGFEWRFGATPPRQQP